MPGDWRNPYGIRYGAASFQPSREHNKMNVSASLSIFGFGLSINNGDEPTLSAGPLGVWVAPGGALLGISWRGRFDLLVSRWASNGSPFRIDAYGNGNGERGCLFLGLRWNLLTGEALGE